MPAQTTTPPRRDGGQGGGHELAGGGEDDRGVELLRRLPRARPLGAERACERLRRLVPRTGHREHPAPFGPRDLGDDVRGRAEAVQPEPRRLAGQAERPVADQPGAEERGDVEVAERLGQREAEPLVGDRPLGVAAVEVVPGEAGPRAEVLASAQAVAALAARPAEPRHPEPPPVLGHRRRSDARGRAAAWGASAPRRRRGDRCGRRRRPEPAAAAARARQPGRSTSARTSGEPGASSSIAFTPRGYRERRRGRPRSNAKSREPRAHGTWSNERLTGPPAVSNRLAAQRWNSNRFVPVSPVGRT